MTLDAYSFCLCGSGKKFKFCCCKDLLHELEKVERAWRAISEPALSSTLPD